MKYKVIRAAAHNFGHSFVSLMNWAGDDYTMNHLARAVVASGATEFTVDLLTGAAQPTSLLTPAVAKSVQNHVRWFPNHLAGEGVEMQHIRRATMMIRFKLQGTDAGLGRRPPWSVPFECVVAIEDDRGKVHVGEVHDVWRVYE